MHKNMTISMVGDNDTNTTVGSRDERLALAEVATLATIFMITVIGNSFVLVGLMMRRIKVTKMYYFLRHLCISDLVTAFFNVLPQLMWDITYRFKGGQILCRSVKFLQILGPYLSSYILVMMAIDRYQAICNPLNHFRWTICRSKGMIAVAWILSLLCCIPQLFIFSYQKLPLKRDVYDCWGTFIEPWGMKAYVTWYSISVFIIPLFILSFTYTCICAAVWRNLHFKADTQPIDNHGNSGCGTETLPRTEDFVMDRTHHQQGLGQVEMPAGDNDNPSTEQSLRNLNPRQDTMGRISRTKVKTVKMAIVVVLCYIACSIPFICVQLWAAWCPEAETSPLWKGPTVTILMLLASLNSCVNPWIYLSFNPNLAKAILNRCSFSLTFLSASNVMIPCRQSSPPEHSVIHFDDDEGVSESKLRLQVASSSSSSNSSNHRTVQKTKFNLDQSSSLKSLSIQESERIVQGDRKKRQKIVHVSKRERVRNRVEYVKNYQFDTPDVILHE